MNPLVAALTLLFTIAAALGLGILLGYAAVCAILRAMHRRPRPVPERALAATQASGGD